MPLIGKPATVYQLFCIIVGFPALVYWSASARERRPAIGIALGEASYAAYVIHWSLPAFVAWGVKTELIGASPVLQLTAAIAIMALSLAFTTFWINRLSRYLNLPPHRSGAQNCCSATE